MVLWSILRNKAFIVGLIDVFGKWHPDAALNGELSKSEHERRIVILLVIAYFLIDIVPEMEIPRMRIRRA